MRNLKLCNAWRPEDSALIGSTHLTRDPYLNEIFIINGDKSVLRLTDSSPRVEILCDLGLFDTSDAIVSFEFILENRMLSIIFSSGRILSFSIADDLLDAVTTKLPEGIDYVSWSPDQETAIITCPKSNRLIVIDRSYEIMLEHDLNTSEYGSESLVSVGWGSKQTQFHGSLGKAAREKKEAVHTILPTDNLKSRVSWRGDGQFFAVSSVDETLNCRVIRIYDRDCTLQFTSEVKENLEHLLSWRPSGEFFVVTQQKFDSHQVSFLEKNGLFFNSFSLPFDFQSIQVEDIAWSQDSKLLSIVITHRDSEQQSILIYSSGNGHWYLKQVLDFKLESGKITALSWDSIQVSVLHVLTASSYTQFTFKWTTTSSACSTVAVIDGKSLLITPFEKCVIPPPMCAYTLKFCQFIRDVSFGSDGDMFVQLIDLNVYKITRSPSSGEIPVSDIFSVEINHTVGPNAAIAPVSSYVAVSQGKFDSDACHLTAAEDGFVLVRSDGNQSHLVHCTGNTTHDYELASSAVSIADGCLAIELDDRSVHKFSPLSSDTTEPLAPWLEDSQKVVFPQLCPSIAAVAQLSFGLSASYTLFCNNQPVLKNSCTSFVLIDHSFLAYTTTTHHLHVISILRSNWIKQIHDEKSNPPIPIERGALIVTHCTSSGSIVLQTRRGNLEVLYPRTLLWSLVKSMINDGEFLPAFEIMRRHRMDFNLIVDTNFNGFMSSIENFVKQIGGKSVDYLVLFVTSLTEDSKPIPVLHEEVTEQEFSIFHQANKSDKIKTICVEMRRIANLIDAKYFLDLILGTYIKCNDYESALRLIAELDESQRDNAFQFMFYFINVNELYNHALGTYSDEITLMVAAKSQKDPLEYRKLLSDLKQIENEWYRRHKIDVLLNRPVKALENLIKCSQSVHRDETLQFIVNNRLYRDALAMITDDQNLLNEVWILYGDYLLAKRYFNEAGIAYSKGSNQVKSMKAHQLSGNWNLALRECQKLQDANALKSLCSTLIHSLTSSGQHIDAAIIADKYLDDQEQTFQILIKGHEWNHASRLVSQVSINEEQEQVYTKLLLDGLIEHSNALNSLIDSETEFLKTHCDRLLLVRDKKLKVQQKKEDEGDLYDDSMSQISSIRSSSIKSSSASGSSRSLKTKKSSVNKEPRQLFKLKQGSRTEDIALVISLKECILRVESLQTELSSLLTHLIMQTDDFTNEQSAVSQLRSKFISLLDFVKNTISLVWVQNLQDTFFIDENTIQLPDDFASMIAKPVFKQIPWDLILLEPSFSKRS